MRIKICGITNVDDALVCEENGAGMIGFVFYEKSKRYISPDSVVSIIGQLSNKVLKVGVFVNAPVAFINDCVHDLKLDFVQLHGDETPDVVGQIGTKVIKAFRVIDKSTYAEIKKFPGTIPLLDTYKKKMYGGTGQTFDWSLIPPELNNDFILSGGISAENVREAVLRTKPYAIDLSSSLESVPGIKDHDKIREFCATFRDAVYEKDRR